MFQKMKTALATGRNPFMSPIGEAAPGASFDDLNPPATFLASLDGAVDGFATDAKSFFGAGGATAPAGIGSPLDGGLSATGPESGLLLERQITLEPGEQRTLYFLYGYLPAGTEAAALVAKYRGSKTTAWKDSSRQWKEKGMRFETKAEPWVKRETAWHYYYLRSSLTYDAFFGEHILSQGGIYQYTMGFQGAARDPLQHALPFLFSDPQIVKEILRYTLKEVRADGSIPYGIVGHGVIAPLSMDNSSDMPLWLLWAASEYVLATRDTAFLDEGIGAGKTPVRALLARCFQHLVKDVGPGEHGVMRMLNDDWNDALVLFWGQKTLKETVEKGESVLNSAMAAWVFDYYAGMLAYAGDDAARVANARQKAEENRKAARAQWTGKWLKRAWIGPVVGWLGEKGLWLEPQPWAILGGITSESESRELAGTMDELLRRDSPIGAMQMNKNPDITSQAMAEPGTSISGGIWPSLNATLVWALARVNKTMAWDEWKKNTLARHAEVYPDVWYNTWSGPDTLNSTLSKHPGETVNAGFLRYTDFPIGNLHSHACTLYSAAKLLGLEFTEHGVDLAPALPLEDYRFDSPLVGLTKGPDGYQGWYAPSKPGEWRIRLRLTGDEARRLSSAEVNGGKVSARVADGAIELRGKSAPGMPLRWALRRG
jgi:cellobiose phosphorylase